MASLAVLRKQVFDRDNHRCQILGCTNGIGDDSMLRMHHIIHKSEGGSDELDNLVTHCAWHHLLDHRVETFKIKIGVEKTILEYLKNNSQLSWSMITRILWMRFLENPSIIKRRQKKISIKQNIFDMVSEYEAVMARCL